jgi:hypothetical protein
MIDGLYQVAEAISEKLTTSFAARNAREKCCGSAIALAFQDS